jgi:DNA invertase Pin-like site-specific DNA recombinase
MNRKMIIQKIKNKIKEKENEGYTFADEIILGLKFALKLIKKKEKYIKRDITKQGVDIKSMTVGCPKVHREIYVFTNCFICNYYKGSNKNKTYIKCKHKTIE